MHKEVRDFVHSVRNRFPQHFGRGHILEVGAHDVNGHVRDLFNPECTWTGVDPRPGPNVHIVSCAHELTGQSIYHAVIATEVFEHDPHLQRTIATMLQLLRPGGIFVATCAGPMREPHGPDHSPLHGFYCNVTTDQLAQYLLLADCQLSEFHVLYARGRKDLYAYAIKE